MTRQNIKTGQGEFQHGFVMLIFIISLFTQCSGNPENSNQNQTASEKESSLQNEAGNSAVIDSAFSSIFSSSEKPDDELFAFKKGDKCGFINLRGEWMIQPKYDAAYSFIEGLALVTLDKKNILIGRTGQSIPLPEGVTDLSTFAGGLAPITIGGKTGFINREGKIVTAPFMDFPAKDISMPSEGMHMVIIDSLFTFVDSTGKIIRQPGFEYALDFFEGLALVSNQGKYGYIDKSGNIAIPMIYDVGWSFSEELALAGIAKGENFQLSFIDRSGKTIIPVPYKIVNPRFVKGLTFFGIEKDGKRQFGFINRSGQESFPPVLDEVKEMVASSSKEIGKVLGFKARKGDLWGLFSGDIMTTIAFSNIGTISEGLAVASTGTGKDQKFGYVDANGNWAIQPQYDGASDFSHGLAAVRSGETIGGKWGYIDKSGRKVIGLQFRYAYDFLGDIAMVQKDNKKAIIDRTGKVLLEE